MVWNKITDVYFVWLCFLSHAPSPFIFIVLCLSPTSRTQTITFFAGDKVKVLFGRVMWSKSICIDTGTQPSQALFKLNLDSSRSLHVELAM